MCMRNIGIEIEPAVVKKNLRYAYGPDAGGCGLSIFVGIGRCLSKGIAVSGLLNAIYGGSPVSVVYVC